MQDRDAVVDRFLAWSRHRASSGAETVLKTVWGEDGSYETGDGVELRGVEPASDDEEVERVWQGDRVGITLEWFDEVTGLTGRWNWIVHVHADWRVSATGKRGDAGSSLLSRNLTEMESIGRDEIRAIRDRDEAEALAVRRELTKWLAQYDMTIGVAESERDHYAHALAVVGAVVGPDDVFWCGEEDAVRGPGWWYVPAKSIGVGGFLAFDDGTHAVLGSGLDLRDWLWAQWAGLDMRSDGPWSVRASANLDTWDGALPGFYPSVSRRLIERGDSFAVRWMELAELRTLVESGDIDIEVVGK